MVPRVAMQQFKMLWDQTVLRFILHVMDVSLEFLGRGAEESFGTRQGHSAEHTAALEFGSGMSLGVVDARLLKRLFVVTCLSYFLSVPENPTANAAAAASTALSVPLALIKGLAFAASLLWFVYDHHRCSKQARAEVTTATDAAAAQLYHHKIASKVMSLVCDYDPTDSAALSRFAPVVRGSRCLFARTATLWGSRDYTYGDESDDIEGHVRRSLPTFLQFLLRNEAEGIDGFVFEIRAHGRSVEDFKTTVRRVLQTIVSSSVLSPGELESN